MLNQYGWLKLAVVSGLLLGFQGEAAVRADPELHGQLRTEGARIVAQDGTPVVLRGGSLMDLVDFEYSEQMVDYLKDAGANLIRIPLHWGRGGLSASYETHWARFSALADYAVAQNLYVIADFHAVASPNQNGLESTAIRFFRDAARRYGSSGQIIYEIFNEPTGKSLYSEKVPWSLIKSYATQRIDEIRAIDPEAFIIVPTATWSQDIAIPLTDPVPRSNIAYAFHFYASFHRFSQQHEDTATRIPIFVTEWAAQSPENSDGSIDLASLNTYVDWMHRHDISWAAWSYSDESQPYGWFHPGSLSDGRVADDELRGWGRMVRDLLDDGQLNQTFTWQYP
jgi:endoglucanase